MAHALSFPSHVGVRQTVLRPLDLDVSRIAANAGAITLNALVLLLLLVPVAMPPQPGPADLDPVITWVRPKIEPIAVDLLRDPLPPKSETIPKPRATPPQPERAVPDRPAIDSAAPDTPLIADDPVVEPGPAQDTDPSLPQGAPTQLQALSAPPPTYPVEAIRSGLTGTVELEILVGIDGKPLRATVVRSSGHRVLDQAARKAVLSQWRFQPARQNGQPVQALGRVPIVFTLER